METHKQKNLGAEFHKGNVKTRFNNIITLI